MIALFRNGRSIWMRAAKTWARNGTDLIIRTSRGREIARFPIDSVCGWYYDNEDITTYGFDGTADREIGK